MARHKSEDKRRAILSAAITQIAKNGLGAATASIAKQAGIPNGSVFTYFETKQDLFNQLYTELKLELISVVREGWPEGSNLSAQFRHNWMQWTQWGAGFPDKRRTLAQLNVSDQLTNETRAAGMQEAEFTLDVIRRVSRNGVLKDRSPAFVFSLVETLASTTVDAMIRDPLHAADIQVAGMEAAWKAIS
jgi:AcrR family transcriptional regulator